MEPVRVAIVGCGVMGGHHARVASEASHIELSAVVDVRQDAAERVGQEQNAKQIYTDVDEMLGNKDIEAVVLALPANLRADLGVKVLQAGKHLLTEKPVARNAGEVERLIEARGDLKAACCSSRYRFFESADIATKAVADGVLGDLRIIRFRGIRPDNGPGKNPPPPWRVSHELNGGGIYVNWGCYDLDYVLGVAGWNVKPKLVLAQAWPIAGHLPGRVAEGSDAESHAIALIHCENGVVFSLERAEFSSLANDEAWQIVGSKASLRLDMLGKAGPRTLYLDKTDTNGPLTTETIFNGEEDRWNCHKGPLEDLATAIRTGGDPKTTLEQALLMQKITDAIYASAREGKAIEIS